MEKKAILLTLLMMAVPVLGVTSTQTLTSTITSTTTDWSNTLTFAQFDSSLGTLTGVTITLTSNVNSTLYLTNNSSKGSSGTANSNTTITLTDSGSIVTCTLDVSSAVINYTLTAGETKNPGAVTGSNTAIYDLSTILAQFTGTGTISFDVDATSETELHNKGGSAYINDDSYIFADLTGTITYTYTPVPEPVTIGLLTFGALTILRKKIKA